MLAISNSDFHVFMLAMVFNGEYGSIESVQKYVQSVIHNDMFVVFGNECKLYISVVRKMLFIYQLFWNIIVAGNPHKWLVCIFYTFGRGVVT